MTLAPAGDVGKGIDGQMILEVPVQIEPIPQSILDKANELEVIIRDVQGNIYN